jgi:hypothetical protein
MEVVRFHLKLIHGNENKNICFSKSSTLCTLNFLPKTLNQDEHHGNSVSEVEVQWGHHSSPPVSYTMVICLAVANTAAVQPYASTNILPHHIKP